MQPHPPVVPLVIETKFPPLRWSLALRSPRITIDGHRVAASWGRTVVPVLPGPHQVQISSSGLFGSPSQIMVDTRWPQTVYYAASWSVFTGGAIGAQPVSSPGVWVRVAELLLPLTIVGLCLAACLFGLFGSVAASSVGQ